MDPPSMLRKVGSAIRLHVDHTCIASTAWHHFYQETLTLLHHWPDAPLRPRLVAIAGIEAIAFTSECEDIEGWRICGDATSRQVGDSVHLPRDFGVALPRSSPTEIVLRAMADDGGLHRLLEGASAGQPYHALVTAVAMLAEDRFPWAAFVGGSIDTADCWTAEDQLWRILGRTVPHPIATDPLRLYRRLRPHLEGDALHQAMDRATARLGGPADALVADLLGERSLRDHVDAELEAAVACTDVRRLSRTAQEAFRTFVATVRMQAQQAGLPARLAGNDGRRRLETVVRATVAYHLALTRMAWDQIERASMPELELLATVAQLQPSGRLGYTLTRALFESEALRRFALEQWGAPSSRDSGNSTRLPS